MRKISLLLILAIMLSFSGCWDMKEINDQSYIVGLGIDAADTEDGYLFTFQKAVPVGIDSSTDSNSIKYENISVTAPSPAEAVRRITMSSSSQFSFEHLSCVIIGSELAHQPFNLLLEYLLQQPDVRRQCVIAIAADTAQSLLSTDTIGAASSINTASLLEELDQSRGRSIIMTLSNAGISAITNNGFCLYVVGENTELKASRPGVSSSDAGGALAVTGAYIFAPDGSINSLDAEKADLLRLFGGYQNDGIISAVHESGKTIYFRINRSRCDVNCDIEDNRLLYHISIDMDCSIADSSGVDNAEISEEFIESSIKLKLNELIALSQHKIGAAALRLDDAARKKDSKWYAEHRSEFEELYHRAVIDLDVECQLERSGVIN